MIAALSSRSARLALAVCWLQLWPVTLPQARGDEKAEVAPSPAQLFSEECDRALAEADAMLTLLESDPGRPTIESVLGRYNDFQVMVNDGGNGAGLMERVHPDADVRQAAADCERRFADLETRARLSRPLYEAILSLDLSGVDAKTGRFVELSLRNFRLAGVHTDGVTRARIRALSDEINALEQAYARNITNDVRGIMVDSRQDLAGMPADWIDARAEGEDGAFRVTTDYPDYLPFMRYSQRDDLRRALFIQFNTRGYPANREVLTRLLSSRNEIARLQGFENWADRAAADKMIGDSDRAREFIDKALAIVRPRAEADYAQLLEWLRQDDPGAERVAAWQVPYLTDRLRGDRFGVSGEELRQYFEYSRVRDGIFQLTTDLFGIDIRERQGADVWHGSVEAYEFVEDGRVLGRFYLDMHPREGKYKHASHVYYRVGVADKRIPESALVCNFPGGGGTPGKLEHRQVESFLHEFGHLVHYHLRFHQPWVAISQPERDFIEAPSQLLEEWLYDPETMGRFAVDDEGKSIPPELVSRTNEARAFGEALRLQGQLNLADLSLSLHDRPPESFAVDTLYQEIALRNAVVPLVPEARKYANFGHLGRAEYSASYYTYVWSQVIADDMFTRFQEAGLRDRETAMAYRRLVLAPGGSRPANELVAAFLGRPFNLEAFQRRLNGTP